jgi:cytochrome bd ubiquinol oxidase subunit I
MFTLDAFHLARVQFAFTVMFHIVFPALSIGLASYLAVLEGLWLASGRQVYLDLFHYWVKIFSIGFAMGVVSGVVMSYQFGTNWAAYSEKTGPIIGPLMGYEVLTAFFLEAGFLGVMLFGMKRVGRGLHFFATLMVALGTLLSATWILSANSWMQTPAGYSIAADGRFMPEDWLAIIFNPSFLVRLPHMVLASYLCVAFLVGGVGAYHLLRGPDNRASRTMFSMALWMATFAAPAQIVVGDLHGLNTLAHQPAKIAALEGDFETERGAPEILFGIPNMREQRTDYQIAVPYLGSLILTHSFDGEVPGLKQWPRADQPYAPLIFFTFRIMVAIGVAMAGLGLVSLWLRWGGRLYRARWLQRAMVAMSPAGFVALLCGWVTTEVGRQPYTVYGLLRTSDSLSPIGLPGVAISLAAFVVVYLIVYAAGVAFLLQLMARPPHPGEEGPPEGVPSHAAGLMPGPAAGAPRPSAAGE